MKPQEYIILLTILLALCIVIYIAQKNYHPDKNEIIGGQSIQRIDSVAYYKGKLLYYENCKACHGSFRQLDGPWQSLAGYPSQWPNRKELFAFIRNPDEVIKTSAYAKDLLSKYGVRMKGSPDLTDDEIDLILQYIEAERKSAQ